MGRRFEASLSGEGLRLAIVVARFNALVTERLLEGAREGLRRHGVRDEDVDEAFVPGSFELPLAARKLAATGRYDAVICLGAVIRGETTHDQYISSQAAAGIQRVALDCAVPVVFGVLTPNTLEQAFDRAGGKSNKGHEAAVTAIEMANLLRAIDSA
ncbi:MAG TPA: 6,7-dimethyl-8-ribityllumazine synthase [Dehalococcoidia bacterium]|nr:6,7-dimethyl-8-ribityllumazine synthase [Dehalococcoidia bacterium]